MKKTLVKKKVVEEEDDDNFEQLLAAKQHRELLATLKQLNEYIKHTEKLGSGVSEVVEKYSKELADLLTKLEVTLQTPVVNNNTELLEALNYLQQSQLKIIELLTIKPIKLTPTINHGGKIESVEVEYRDITLLK